MLAGELLLTMCLLGLTHTLRDPDVFFMIFLLEELWDSGQASSYTQLPVYATLVHEGLTPHKDL